jgi:hypothetical protein
VHPSIVVSPTSPQRGESVSDSLPSVSKVHHQILSIEFPSHYYRAIHRLILVVCPLQVLKGGIVSPTHVSTLVLQPRRHPHIPASSSSLKSLLESSHWSVESSSGTPILCYLVIFGTIWHYSGTTENSKVPRFFCQK